MQLEKNNQVYFDRAILCFVVFCVMFTLSLLTPLIADDFNYAFGYSNDQRINSIRDIIISMSWHRKLLNGRVFSHACLSFVLMYPRWFFAVLNAFVAVLFSWTTTGFLIDHDCEHPTRATTYTWILFWICMPGFGQIFFWTAGACNYFWGLTLAWFIIWKTIRLSECHGKKHICSILLLSLLAFVTGAWSEHISFSMLLSIFLLAFRKTVIKKRFPWTMIIILLSGCFGYLFLMLAPATKLFQRLHDAGDPTEANNLSRLIEIVPGGVFSLCLIMVLACTFVVIIINNKGLYAGGVILSSITVPISIFATLFAVVLEWRKNGIIEVVSSANVGFFTAVSLYSASLFLASREKTDKDKIVFSLILSLSGLCGFAMFIFGEYLPLRGFCAPVSFLVFSGVYLLESTNHPEKAIKFEAIILGLLFIISFSLGVSDIVSVHQQAVKRVNSFKNAATGNKTLITEPYHYQTKYSAQYGNPDLSQGADWPNGVMAEYYGIDRIIVEY